MTTSSKSTAALLELPPTAVDPVIAKVLRPDERVHWQGAYRPFRMGAVNSLVLTAVMAVAGWWWFGQTGELQALQAQLEPLLNELRENPQLRSGLLVTGAVIMLASLFLGRGRYWHFALTNERVLVLRNGKLREQAAPEEIIILGRRPFGWVLWRYAEGRGRQGFGSRSVKGRSGFKCKDDPKAVEALLRRWQARPTLEAQRSSEAFRRNMEGEAVGGSVGDAASPQPAPSASAPQPILEGSAEGSITLVNRQLGFRVDLPEPWRVEVEQRFDGPLRLFGVTLLPRLVREGTRRRPQDNDGRPWNCIISRGGPAVGVDFSVQRERPMPSPESVSNDRWAKLLRVEVFHVEEDIRIGDFVGFAVVRQLHQGADIIGFGMLPVPVLLRQWWLQGRGLTFEIQGVAPKDSPVLQDTVDLIVKSLRSL